ncbi:hypothetical protein [Limnohabitans sp.]|uniref:hypothetical protein n=1 Tax=Limnohabitans sp. TaxID=1907725 RepID=UPI00286F0078|nr:hypothetical protein [Limnohabitans sp.]
MSDTQVAERLAHTPLTHAGEVAHWFVLLLGWLWLGEQGMHLGWSWASGVLAVAAWWAVRLLCRGSAWAFGCQPYVLGLCGGFTLLGVCVLQSAMTQPFAHALLLGVAVVWGLWSALIETRSRVSTFQLGPVAWHSVVAAGLVGLGWQWPAGELFKHPGLIFLLALCAGLVYAHDHRAATCPIACRGPRASLQTLLAPSAMGLMMGSLWLGNAWCASLGWSTQHMVGAHLALMAGLPTLAAWVMRHTGPSHAASKLHVRISLLLLVLGALMQLGDSTAHGVLAMLLPSLAWALHCCRQRGPNVLEQPFTPWASRSWALLLGPVLLVWMGMASPLHGPWAMHAALALLGVLAAGQLVVLWWRKQQGMHSPVTVT